MIPSTNSLLPRHRGSMIPGILREQTIPSVGDSAPRGAQSQSINLCVAGTIDWHGGTEGVALTTEGLLQTATVHSPSWPQTVSQPKIPRGAIGQGKGTEGVAKSTEGQPHPDPVHSPNRLHIVSLTTISLRLEFFPFVMNSSHSIRFGSIRFFSLRFFSFRYWSA